MYRYYKLNINVSTLYNLLLFSLFVTGLTILNLSNISEQNKQYDLFCGYVTSSTINYNNTDHSYHVNTIISEKLYYLDMNDIDKIKNCTYNDYYTDQDYHIATYLASNNLFSYKCMSRQLNSSTCNEENNYYKERNYINFLFLLSSSLTIFSGVLSIISIRKYYNFHNDY